MVLTAIRIEDVMMLSFPQTGHTNNQLIWPRQTVSSHRSKPSSAEAAAEAAETAAPEAAEPAAAPLMSAEIPFPGAAVHIAE